MPISISSRIQKTFLYLTLVLCVIFATVTTILVYVIEDQVFINILKAEQKHYQQLSPENKPHWQPENTHIKLIRNFESLPNFLKPVIRNKIGIYEYFVPKSSAFFILYDLEEYSLKPFYLVFDVSELLAVRENYKNLFILIGIISLGVLMISLFIASWLTQKILMPIKKLTNQLLVKDNTQLPANFSAPFADDEIGILTKELQDAINQAAQLTRKEFDFNRGVSHELRSPIQVAQTAMELLKHKTTKNKKTVMQRLNRAISNMQYITDAFLWLASDRTIADEQSDGHQCCIDLIKKYQHLYPNRHIHIITESTEKPLYPVPYPVLSVIIDNLLRNALQHTQSGKIELILNHSQIQIVNEIKENHSAESGYGIGLVIIRRICERLGWKILFDTDSTNLYSTISTKKTIT